MLGKAWRTHQPNFCRALAGPTEWSPVRGGIWPKVQRYKPERDLKNLICVIEQWRPLSDVHCEVISFLNILSMVLHDLYVENLDIFLRFLLVYSRILNLVDNIQPLNSSSEDCMLVVKPRLQSVR
jgi:hypothetical protein